MFTLKDKLSENWIIGWNLETGKAGVFRVGEKAQQAYFTTENDAWNFMGMLEDVLKIDVQDLTVTEC